MKVREKIMSLVSIGPILNKIQLHNKLKMYERYTDFWTHSPDDIYQIVEFYNG